MLEDVDILRLAHTSTVVHGILQRYLARYYKRENLLLQLVWGIADDAIQTRLQDAVESALERIRKVGRDLGRNAPPKNGNPHTDIYVARKFNVTKIEIMRSIDERVCRVMTNRVVRP